MRDLAERTGFSASFLSQVERGTSSASTGPIAKIAVTLDTPLSASFAVPEQATLAVPHDERVPLHVDNAPVAYMSLASGVRRRTLEPVIATPPPRFEPQEGLCRHRGEELGFVLEGPLSIAIDGQEYALGPGDSIHFKSGVPHSSGAHGTDKPTVVLWVVTPTLL